jgi:RimJ/RimL family protein N-acetyltransferase
MNTQNLLLRHLLVSDKQELWHYVSSPLVTRFLTWKYYTNQISYLDYFTSAQLKMSFPDEVLGIVNSANKLIGTIHFINRENKAVQFGFGIIPELWNQGIGTKVAELGLNYLDESQQWSVLPIWADVHQENKAAIKVLKKNNFSLVKKSIEFQRDRYSFINSK